VNGCQKTARVCCCSGWMEGSIPHLASEANARDNGIDWVCSGNGGYLVYSELLQIWQRFIRDWEEEGVRRLCIFIANSMQRSG